MGIIEKYPAEANIFVTDINLLRIYGVIPTNN